MNTTTMNAQETNTRPNMQTSLPNSEADWHALLQTHIQHQSMHPLIKGISVSLNVLNKFSTQAAGNKAFGLWFTPQSKPIRSEDKAWLDQAEISSLTIPKIRSGNTIQTSSTEVPVYRWHRNNPTGEKVLCVHGWGGHAGQFSHLSKTLVQHGYQVLSFDLPGHGLAKGKSSNLAEMSLIVEQLFALEGQFKAIIAHSLGGVGVNSALNQLTTQNRCNKFVLLNAPMSLDHMVHTFKHQLQLNHKIIEQHKRKLTKTFGEGVWQTFDLRNRQHNTPTLMCYDKNDDQVPAQVAYYLNQTYQDSTLIETATLGHNKGVRDQSTIERIIDYIN